jgi:hypothetical protein
VLPSLIQSRLITQQKRFGRTSILLVAPIPIGTPGSSPLRIPNGTPRGIPKGTPATYTNRHPTKVSPPKGSQHKDPPIGTKFLKTHAINPRA